MQGRGFLDVDRIYPGWIWGKVKVFDMSGM